MAVADPDSHIVDPALGLASDHAAGRAIAAQTAAVAIVWKGVFDGSWLERFTLYRTAHDVIVIVAAAVAGLLLGRVAARARTSARAVGRAILLGVLGGAVVELVGFPLAHIGSTWAPGVTRLDILVNDLFGGAFLGFFAGLTSAPLLVHHVRIRCALDVAPRLYLVACTTLLVPCLLVSLFGGLRGVPLLIVAIALYAFAVRAGRRRLAWLDRVRADREPGFRLDEVPEASQVAALPAFSGDAAQARGVVLHAAEGGDERGAHPFRAGGPWIGVARVALDPGWASLEAQGAMRRSAITGVLSGLLLFVLGGVPVLLFVIAIGT